MVANGEVDQRRGHSDHRPFGFNRKDPFEMVQLPVTTRSSPVPGGGPEHIHHRKAEALLHWPCIPIKYGGPVLGQKYPSRHRPIQEWTICPPVERLQHSS